MTDITVKNTHVTPDIYRTSYICNLISSLTFTFLTAANVIEKGVTHIENFPLGVLALIFGSAAVYSFVKYRKGRF
ncbi:MAG: hypothetical protein IKH23_02610 [Clostridiales bacterium]|nr:hypothetical protein [Clostridiales bacterium]